MKIAIRYYTRSGNTETLARAIEDVLGVKAESVAVPLHEKVDILFLGCSYYAFDVDEAVKNFITQNKDHIGKIVCFGTSAMMKSTHKPMKKVCGAAGVLLSDGEFHCRGSFGPMHKGHPDETDLKNAAAFARKTVK
ncbi:MAG: flavodoxin [Oscillospiraceae bacterium]|nr:flavodoxin [Oscillospiraceae bacterium]